MNTRRECAQQVWAWLFLRRPDSHKRYDGNATTGQSEWGDDQPRVAFHDTLARRRPEKRDSGLMVVPYCRRRLDFTSPPPSPPPYSPESRARTSLVQSTEPIGCTGSL